MNPFNYSQIFKTAEKSKEESYRELKIQKITEMLDKEFELSLMKSSAFSFSQITDRHSLMKKYNQLLFTNQQKSKELDSLKDIIENLKKSNSSAIFTQKKSENLLIDIQSSINSRYAATESEKLDLIEKLKEEIVKINSKIEQEYFTSERLAAMKSKAKKSLIDIKKKVWEMQTECDTVRKYENKTMIIERTADNEKIRCDFENTIQRSSIKTERIARKEKLTLLAKKQIILKKDTELLTTKFVEDTVKNDDQKEFKMILSQDLREALSDHDELRFMSKKIQAKLEAYEEVFFHIKELTGKSKCLDLDPESPGLSIPQEVTSCFSKMISIETKLKERFEYLTSIHNKLKYKCDKISYDLSMLKKLDENCINFNDLKHHTKVLRCQTANNGITLTDLIISWDTYSNDTQKQELIEKYENISFFTYKFLSETCTKVASTLQRLFLETGDIKSQAILQENSTFLTEVRETLSSDSFQKSPKKSNSSQNSSIGQKIESSIYILQQILSGHAELTKELEIIVKSYEIPEQKQPKLSSVLSAPVSKHNSKSISDLLTSAIKMKVQELIKKKSSAHSGLKAEFEDFVKRFKINEVNINDLNTEEILEETDSQSGLNLGHTNMNESTMSPRTKRKRKTNLPKLYQIPTKQDRRNVIQEVKLLELRLNEVKKLSNKNINKKYQAKGLTSRASTDKSVPSFSQSDILYKTYSHMPTKRK
ncbi:unnamed protein product [Blepharisma stoltei]|uniref:Uncharacterized protein n=1 Tax=Blepharisma stoltei TaxID=1481888 RepID=A0AAU9IUA2_9CILI|nr:unnamed protein product [Blepharisma stoltei]